MKSELLGLCIMCFCVLLLIAETFLFNFNKYLNKKNQIRELEAKNKNYELLASIDIDNVSSKIDTYIEERVKRYILFNFISKKIIYIKEEESEKMCKRITELVCIELSELYLFYVRLLVNIKSDEDLIKFVNTKVKMIVAENVSNYNTSQLP